MSLSQQPMFCCCIMYPTDYELETGTGDIELGEFAEDSFQGFAMRAAKVVRRDRPALEIAEDVASCGFNTVLLVGFCGSNFAPEDLRSPRFVELTQELKKRGMAVGVCIPFADTVDNRLTRDDPLMYQRRHDGKRTFIRFDPSVERPPYALYNIDYGCERFVQFAQDLVLAARDAGMDLVDYAEPDQWPTEDNGYGGYLSEAYRRSHGEPPPHPSTLEHRLFMEDYHIEGMKRISAFAHSHGILDHLTASPMGHAPYLICQNYGKYAGTSITELSSTYHYSYGLQWRRRIKELYGVDFGGHRLSSMGCLEARYMRGWEERHATYLVPGQSLPVETYAAAIDQQMFLHNMDVVFWEFPSIKDNYYETTEPWMEPAETWEKLRRMLRTRFEKYRSLPAAYHHAIPVPQALVYYSKRGVYADPKVDRSTPCAYATALKLQGENLPIGFLYSEYMEPLRDLRYDANLLLVDEHQPVSSEGWAEIRAWLRLGSRIVVYGGRPGLDWATLLPMEELPRDVAELLGVRVGRSGDRPPRVGAEPLTAPLPSTLVGLDVALADDATVLAMVRGRPFVSVRQAGAGSLVAYVAAPLCELPVSFLAELCDRLLGRTQKRSLWVDGPLDLESCLYKAGRTLYLALRNSCCEKRAVELGVRTGSEPESITELMGGTPIQGHTYAGGRTVFHDAPEPNSVRIYEIVRSRGTEAGS